MDNNYMEDMQISSKPKKQKEVSEQPLDVNHIAEVISSSIANAMNAVSQQRAAEQANANVISVAINKKVMDKSLKQIEFQNKIIADLNQKKNCKMYAIPKIYAEYQPSFTVSINGCTIKVPADGVPRLVHNRYIDIIEQRLRHLDDKISNMNGYNVREMSRY